MNSQCHLFSMCACVCTRVRVRARSVEKKTRYAHRGKRKNTPIDTTNEKPKEMTPKKKFLTLSKDNFVWCDLFNFTKRSQNRIFLVGDRIEERHLFMRMCLCVCVCLQRDAG